MPNVRIGTKFRSVHADSNPEFTVTKSLGHGIWECTVEGDDVDWVGLVRNFHTKQIEAHVRMDSFWADKAKQKASFWADRTVGETLHYHDGFGQYVRGVVEFGELTHGGEGYGIRPVALVGAWKSHDLPHRLPSGEIHLPYQAKKILEPDQEKGLWQPSDTGVWEASVRLQATHPNVPHLPEIDLSVPDMDNDQHEVAEQWRLLEEIEDAILYRDASKDPAEILNKIRNMLST